MKLVRIVTIGSLTVIALAALGSVINQNSSKVVVGSTAHVSTGETVLLVSSTNSLSTIVVDHANGQSVSLSHNAKAGEVTAVSVVKLSVPTKNLKIAEK